jgi:hypothetical protein
MGAGKRNWLVTAAVVLAAGAVAGIGVFALLLSSWSDLAAATPAEADAAFAAARVATGGGPAYLEVAADGSVGVRRELERDAPVRLRTLHVMAWDPARGQLLHIGFPFWFVRAKLTDTVNLGTLTTAAAGDWSHLDLQVSESDLQRRGPGLILDQRGGGGSRILLWTE